MVHKPTINGIERELRLCRYMEMPKPADQPEVQPRLKTPEPEKQLGPVKEEVGARIQGAEKLSNTVYIQNFKREVQVFLEEFARVSTLRQSAEKRQDALTTLLQQENTQLEKRALQYPGAPRWVLALQPEGLIATMNESVTIPLTGPLAPKGNADALEIDLPEDVSKQDVPPDVAGRQKESVKPIVKAMQKKYEKQLGREMTPEQRSTLEQQIIGELEFEGYNTPQSVQDVLEGKEQLVMAEGWGATVNKFKGGFRILAAKVKDFFHSLFPKKKEGVSPAAPENMLNFLGVPEKDLPFTVRRIQDGPFILKEKLSQSFKERLNLQKIQDLLTQPQPLGLGLLPNEVQMQGTEILCAPEAIEKLSPQQFRHLLERMQAQKKTQ